MMRKILGASLLALAAVAPFANAFEAGNIIVRAGAVTVDPHEDSGAINHATLGTIGGTHATLDSDTQLGLNFAYMLTDKIGVELLAATPFSHTVGVKGMPAAFSTLNGDLANIKQLPPTVSVVYYPLDSKSAVQPYVGLGLNYTWFFDTKLTSAAEGKGFTGFDLQDSVGLAAQVGADFMLTDNWLVNAQVRYVDIDTKGTTYLAGNKVKVNVDVDPYAYMVGVGYKF